MNKPIHNCSTAKLCKKGAWSVRCIIRLIIQPTVRVR